MKICVLFGLLIALAGAALGYVEFLLGYHNDPSKFETGGTIGSIGGPVIMIIGLTLGIRAARESRPDKSLGYGRGVLIGTAIGCFAGLFGALTTYAYGVWVNPGYHQLLHERQLAEISSLGLPEDQMAMAERMAAFMTSPAAVALLALISAPVVCCIISLVVAAFLKRSPEVSGSVVENR